MLVSAAAPKPAAAKAAAKPAANAAPIEPNAGTPLIVRLGARPNFGKILSMPIGPERKAAAYEKLVETAKTSQEPLLAIAQKLQEDGKITGFESMVSPNALIVRANSSARREVLDAFKGAKEVSGIFDGSTGMQVNSVKDIQKGQALIGKQPLWGFDGFTKNDELGTMDAPQEEMPWNLTQLGAPDAWKAGATGKGLVYGSVDTGVDWKHEALKYNYRGVDAKGNVAHDYNWFDASGKTTEPTDRQGHGTHTVGSVAGHINGRHTGVAPEAKWIAANALVGGTEQILKSLQWMQAPTKVDGSAPDPTKAPDVVGMSWWNGAANQDNLYRPVFQNFLAAGILPVKSAGNKGPGPETISSPGQFPEVFAVAAVDKNGDIAEFSSRGPSPLPHTSSTPGYKPDFAAPGKDVVSSVPGDKYAAYSGTSMAQPHFSGALLALLSKYPTLTPAQITKVMAAGAVDAGSKGRDLEHGWGNINLPTALAAAEKLVKAEKPAPAPRAKAAKSSK